MRTLYIAFVLLFFNFLSTGNAQEPEKQLMFMTYNSVGGMDLSTRKYFTLHCDKGYLELILSPVERITYIDGNFFSYTFFDSIEAIKKRAKLNRQYKFSIGNVQGWNLTGETIFENTYYRCKDDIYVIAIDGRHIKINYDKEKKCWIIEFI